MNKYLRHLLRRTLLEWVHRFAVFLVVSLSLSLTSSSALAFKGAIGYTQLQAALGSSTPDGTGIVISQVESANGNCPSCSYFPNREDSQFVGKTINNGSGISDSFSSHANGMGRFFYGLTTGIAPGITNITVYESNDYLFEVLNTSKNPSAPTNGNTGPDPDLQQFAGQEFRIQNHSWVGTIIDSNDNPLNNLNLDALRRFDYVIDNQEIIMPVGVDNGAGSALPNLFAHSYNSIAVGRTDGAHSAEPTNFTLYGTGRIKPQLVVPEGTASRATAVTSSAAAMLYESGMGTNAVLTEPMRAILLAGATKGEFNNWERTATQPLDTTFGAGELNVWNSWRIQNGGEYNGSAGDPNSPVGDFGWDYGEINSSTTLSYDLEVPDFHTGTELSVLLTWNVNVTDSRSSPSQFHATHSLANLDLHLYDSSGGLVDYSQSLVENIEHIYLTDLAPGTYTLEVSSNSTRDFGLAWRLSNIADGRFAGDYNGNGVVEQGDYALWVTSLGSRLDLRADGDDNGVVDQADYAIWKSGLGQTFGSAAQVAAANVIPEPSTWALLCMLLLSLLPRRR